MTVITMLSEKGLDGFVEGDVWFRWVLVGRVSAQYVRFKLDQDDQTDAEKRD